MYFYHPDQLGSSSYISYTDGEMVQHNEYVPFGEVLLEDRNAARNYTTPFLFNGKELDEETGLYYYGSRYYNPRISNWLSVDPLWENAPEVSLYIYTLNNPINYIDPTGEWPDLPSFATLKSNYNKALASTKKFISTTTTQAQKNATQVKQTTISYGRKIEAKYEELKPKVIQSAKETKNQASKSAYRMV